MRLYCIAHGWLSDKQKGIQAAGHAQTELWLKYVANSVTCDPDSLSDTEYDSAKKIVEWAHHHKTIILLNGGSSSALFTLLEVLSRPENPYPWAEFAEDRESLEGATTGVCVVLPERMYARDAQGVRIVPDGDWSLWEQDLIYLLDRMPLA